MKLLRSEIMLRIVKYFPAENVVVPAAHWIVFLSPRHFVTPPAGVPDELARWGDSKREARALRTIFHRLFITFRNIFKINYFLSQSALYNL